MKAQTEAKPYDSINVTPMLDLAYVLLVIFIIMTTATVQGLSISLPKPSDKPNPVKKELRIVQVMPGGRYLLNGASVSTGELESMLSATRAKFPDMSLMVKGDPEADYANVVWIIDLAGRLNIANLGLVTSKIGT
ncbi:MAG: biopolymer transporter ExbD [Betaproteobacteria bacterium]